MCAVAGAVVAPLHSPAAPDAAADEPDRDLAFTLRTTAYFGEIDGFVQTTTAGQAGTSTPSRPKLDEIGVSEVVMMEFTGIVSRGRDNLLARARILPTGGTTSLDESFVSDGQLFDAGTLIDTDTNFNQYLLAYGRDFDVTRSVMVRPLVGVTLMSIRYHFENDLAGAPVVDHRDDAFAAQLGADAEWRPGGGPFSLAARGLLALPIDGLGVAHEAQLLARYDVHRRGSGEPSATVFAGVSFQHLAFEDDDGDAPDEFEADLGPLITVGFDLRF